VDLLFYDDVLAVVPRPAGADPGLDPRGWLVVGLVSLLIGPRLRRRRERRERSPATLPRRTRYIRYDDVREVVVERRAYSGAFLRIDGRTFDVPAASYYRAPWTDVLGPFFGDRLTVTDWEPPKGRR
jgi:hypothetical protein